MDVAPRTVSFRRADSALVARARAYLAHGPATPVDLIGHVCNLPGPPEAVASHLADVLLGAEHGFARSTDGRWTLSSPDVAMGAERKASADRGSEASAYPSVKPSERYPGVAERRRAHAGPSPQRAASPSQRTDAPATSSVALSQLSFAVVDVETTGTRAGWGDRITEIAAVRVESGEVVDVFETLVNPERPIPPYITQLTRITSEMVRTAPRFADVAPRVEQALAGRIFVAHNATFDWRFVSTEMERATGQQLIGERVCTVRLARTLLPMLRRRSLDSVARYFGVEIAARHRAAGDAVATAQVLIALLRLAEDKGVATLDELRLLGLKGRGRRRKRRAMPHWMTRDETA